MSRQRGTSVKNTHFLQGMGKGTTLLTLTAALLVIITQLAGADDPAHLVTGLPGQPPVGFKQYAGFITLEDGKSFFYWFVAAQNGDPAKQPVAFWFNGGPGCSSLGNGALKELGPFYVNSTGNGLVLNQFAWNREANIVFLESPVSVGYSYSANKTDYQSFTDDKTAEAAHAFLVGWFNKFGEYADNDIYLVGESYAGHYVPQLAQKVVQYNEKGGFHINLKGFMVGNAWTDPYNDNKGAVEFHHSNALISYQTYRSLIENCNFAHELALNYSLASNERCKEASVQAFYVQTAYVDIYNIYGKYCPRSSSNASRGISAPKSPFISFLAQSNVNNEDPCNDVVTPYLNLPQVITAFHANNSTNLPWRGCSATVDAGYSTKDVTTSILPLYRELLQKGLKIWVYSGDVDGIIPTLSTRSWLKALDLPVEIPWYAWNQSNQVGGWTEKYKGLTFATVHDAGHMVPMTQPERALTLFHCFLKEELLPAFE